MLIWKQTIATKKTSLGWRLRATLVPFALSYTLCTDQNNVFSFFFLISHLLVCVCIYIYAFTRETTTEQTRSDSSVGFLVCQVVWRCLIWQRLILMLITPQWQHVLGAQGTSRHKTTTTRGLRWEQIDDKDSTKGDVLFFFLLELAEAFRGEHTCIYCGIYQFSHNNYLMCFTIWGVARQMTIKTSLFFSFSLYMFMKSNEIFMTDFKCLLPKAGKSAEPDFRTWISVILPPYKVRQNSSL